MKKLSLILAAILLLMSAITVNADQPVTVIFDSTKLKLAANPISENGATLVPLKSMLDAFGAKIIWNQANGSATVTKGNTSIWLQLNSTTAKINNTEKKLAAAPKVVNGNTMVPLILVTEAFQATQLWDENAKTLYIFTKKAVQKQYYDNGKLKYEGELVNGLYNGKGTYYWEDGSKYQGDYLNHQSHGFGVITWPSGDKYEGQWKYGQKTGYGTYTWPSGNKYTGQWVNGDRVGQGTLIWANGDKYVGEWAGDQQNGKGVMTWANGETYDGYWVNGKMSDKPVDPAVAAQMGELEKFKKQAYDGPSYNELNKGASKYLNMPAYFNGKIIQAQEDSSGNTFLLIDISSGSNDFIDMYNQYNTGGYYVDNVESKLIAVFSNKSVDLLEDDTAGIYGTVTNSFTYTTRAGYTMTVPALNLYTFDRTNYRSDEIYDMMFGPKG